MFTAFDGFEKERFILPANLAIRRKRSLDIGEETSCDWDQIAALGELAKLFEGGGVHGSCARFIFLPAADFLAKQPKREVCSLRRHDGLFEEWLAANAILRAEYKMQQRWHNQ